MEFKGLTSASHMSLPEAGYGVRRGLCGFGDIRGSVGRYDPWGIKATGFAVTTKINHYAAVTAGSPPVDFRFAGASASVLKSSTHKVPDEVYAILESHGYTPTSPSSAYSMLVHLYELVETKRSGTQILGRLKRALATSEL